MTTHKPEPTFPLLDDSFCIIKKKKKSQTQNRTASTIFLQALNSNVDETWLFFNACKTNCFHLETIYTWRPHPAWPQSQALLVQLENPISFYEEGHLGVPQNLISLHVTSNAIPVGDPKIGGCSGQWDEPSHPQRPPAAATLTPLPPFFPKMPPEHTLGIVHRIWQDSASPNPQRLWNISSEGTVSHSPRCQQ